MKLYRFRFFILFITLLGIAACSTTSSNDVEPEKPDDESDSDEEIVYTLADATKMFEAFNNYYFNKDKNLYYKTTYRTELAVGWTQAIYLYMVMDAYQRTDNEKYLDLVEKLYKGAKGKYSGFYWPDVKWKNRWIYDDMMWWVIGLARAYQITGKQKYLETAIEGFDFVWSESYDAENGGMIWSWKSTGKTACINYPTVIGAIRLYNITGDKSYLSKAKKIYSWARKNLFQESTGRVADNTQVNAEPVFQDYTYNQGTLIGAAYMLYTATGNQMYMEDAIAAADYTKYTMSNSNGILPKETGEGGLFKTIFIHYMTMLIKQGDQTQYMSWMQKNAEVVWSNRAKSRNLMCTDYTVTCSKVKLSSYEASSGVELLLVIPHPSKK